jgi:CBS domain-containing protein
MKISEIMTNDCEWITPETTVTEAAKIMRDKDFGFLPVGDEQEKKLVGTLTDRDIVVRCTAAGFDPSKHEVRHIMTENVLYCFQDDDVEKVCRNMAEVRVRRMPVMTRDKKLVGVVSFGDVAQAAREKDIAQTQQELTRECAEKDRKAAA